MLKRSVALTVVTTVLLLAACLPSPASDAPVASNPSVTAIPPQTVGHVEVVYDFIENRFPRGITFKMKARAEEDIREVKLLVKLGPEGILSYANPAFEPGKEVVSEYSFEGYRTLPPGTEMEYWYEFIDAGGNKVETPGSFYEYLDTRFQWRRLSRGHITVLYYGSRDEVARGALDTAFASEESMGTILGSSLRKPVKLVLYSSLRDAQDALSFRSLTTDRERHFGGEAVTSLGVVVLVATDRDFKAGVAHEITHFIVHEAAGERAFQVPAWLNEGLAEYAARGSGHSTDPVIRARALEGSLPSLERMGSIPGLGPDIALFYRQSLSVVSFMIESYGAEGMRALFERIREGEGLDEAIEGASGFSLRNLEQEWRSRLVSGRA